MNINHLKSCFIIVFSIIVVLFLFFIVFKNFMTEQYSSSFNSGTILESKKNGVFIKKVKMIPPQVIVDNRIISIKEAWVEERTKILYSYLFFRTIKKLGTYYICFTLKNPSSDNIDSKFAFQRQDSTKSFAISGGRVFYDCLKTLDIKEIKVNIIQRDDAKSKSMGLIKINM